MFSSLPGEPRWKGCGSPHLLSQHSGSMWGQEDRELKATLIWGQPGCMRPCLNPTPMPVSISVLTTRVTPAKVDSKMNKTYVHVKVHTIQVCGLTCSTSVYTCLKISIMNKKEMNKYLLNAKQKTKQNPETILLSTKIVI